MTTTMEGRQARKKGKNSSEDVHDFDSFTESITKVSTLYTYIIVYL